MLEKPRRGAARPALRTEIAARILRHDAAAAMTTLQFEDGELRAPLIDHPAGADVVVRIEARDVSIALSRPMDVSITNRMPGEIIEITPLEAPYVRVAFNLGHTRLYALVTGESVERLALAPGLRAWVMIKAVVIAGQSLRPDRAPKPRPWPLDRR